MLRLNIFWSMHLSGFFDGLPYHDCRALRTDSPKTAWSFVGKFLSLSSNYNELESHQLRAPLIQHYESGFQSNQQMTRVDILFFKNSTLIWMSIGLLWGKHVFLKLLLSGWGYCGDILTLRPILASISTTGSRHTGGEGTSWGRKYVSSHPKKRSNRA